MDGTKKYNFVLVIDDSEMENSMNLAVITQNGFCNEAKAQCNPKDALKFLSSASNEKLPEIIFLDINMPDMDGFAFLEEFEKLPDTVHKKSKIVMLSSSDSFKDLNRANKNKFVRRFLNKPLTQNMLQAINF
jgi:CheY-like chemotaxis protein